mgnify:FL=1|tara:strand:+ start:1712 stop:2380 length:669 start_codon:yes stop_codon:yes gene_type:complete
MNTLNHVAFIMDGNGRWGKKKGKNRNYGHLQGVETVKKIVKASIKINIPILTFYVFSSENWKRPKSEINYLLNLIKIYFLKEIKNIKEQGIKLNILGEKNKLSLEIREVLKKSVAVTKNNKKIIVNLAINYGSKNEILLALKKIKKKVNIKNFEKNLYTKQMPFPDILIRTGGRQRLSNFMLWQLAYTELFFLKKLWPDFTSTDFIQVLNKYQKIKRNFGKI